MNQSTALKWVGYGVCENGEVEILAVGDNEIGVGIDVGGRPSGRLFEKIVIEKCPVRCV